MGVIDLHHPLTVCRASAGTGKTYTLSAYYIGLLLSGESYRNILAVTFTNAATAEMKERILTYLLGIAEGGEDDFLRTVHQYMIRDSHLPDSVLRARAGELLHAILQDYDNFSVSTIDAFLQQLIRGMAQAIDRTADFNISLDVDQVITRAVDMLLTTGLTEVSRQSIEDYVAAQIEDDKRWDVRANLIRIAKQFYREQVQMYNAKDSTERLCLDEQKIADYRSELLKQRAIARAPLEKAAMQANQDMDNRVPYTTPAHCTNTIKNIYKSLTATNDVKPAERFRGVPPKSAEKIANVPQIAALQALCDHYRPIYWRTECELSFLSDMRLMDALSHCINEALRRTNTALLADTAITLADALQPGDADFILEKAGIRYRHIMIDEFQDTSTLQWKVFLHLINDVLAVEGQTVLIVGDIKQSIYRFRNGNWQIMAGLGVTELCAPYNREFLPLIRNQRSRKNVVAFNLGVMKHIIAQNNVLDPDTRQPIGDRLYNEDFSDDNISNYYREDKHPGGYVRCRIYPYMKKSDKTPPALLKPSVQDAIHADVCATIEQLLSRGERPADILILARKNEQIGEWVTFCRAHEADYPILAHTPLVSRDSFRLEACTTVLVLVEALRYIHSRSRTAQEFVSLHCGAQAVERIETIPRYMPLYEQLQRIFQVLFCNHGIYQGEDTAYINCFFDALHTFITTNGSDADAFLQYWQDKLYKTAIAGDSTAEAIMLMTVHTAKGLEGKTVIILHCDWPTDTDHNDDILWSPTIEQSDLPVIPIRQASYLLQASDTPYKQAYLREHDAQRVDSYNLLYVALTRAADNLYIYAMPLRSDIGKEYTDMAATLIDYTGTADQLLQVDGTTSRFAEYTVGDEPFILRDAQQKSLSPFSFSRAEGITATMHSTDEQVQFRQSQESEQYTAEGAEADTAIAQADFGTLCHDIFAHVEREEDILPTVDRYRQQGLIESDTQRRQIETLLLNAFRHQQMAEWFDGSWTLKREASIITPGGMIRPDRVMIRGNQAVVLDYKFAARKPIHIDQVRDYMTHLERMGYTPVEGWLWYAFDNNLVSVK